MSKSRILTLVLTLALALAAAPAVMAQDESAAPEASPEAGTTAETFDPGSVPEFNQDEALIAYAIFREELLAMGVAEEDIGEATAYLEGEAAGTVAIYRMDNEHCELKSMFVAPGYRKNGVAAALCDAVIALAKTQGYQFVRLTTGVRQLAARRLYEKLGF